MDPSVEDSYLSCHHLNAGVAELLAGASQRFHGVCGLSNDVSQWSQKLRRAFGLERAINPWIVSADIGHRKPAPEIYLHLLDCLKVPAEMVVFVDDRMTNLDAAGQIGMRTVLFDPMYQQPGGSHRRIGRLVDLLALDF